MSEPISQPQPSDPPANEPTVQVTKPSPKPLPKKRRRWPKVFAGVAVFLVLLVLLLPTLISTSPVRSFIVGQIDKNLQGRVEIADWSVGWTGGITVRGVKIFDASNAQIAELKSASTQLLLLNAIRGNLALGETTIDGADFALVLYPDGTNNFSKLAKSSSDSASPASDLPELSGTIHLVNARGTVTKLAAPGGTSHTLHLTAIAGEVAISEINQPIDSSLNISARVDNGTEGSVAIVGKSAVIKNRRVNLDSASGDQTLTLKSLDAGAVLPFLPPGIATQLAGIFDGTLRAQFVDGKSVVLQTQIKGRDILFASPGFKGGEAYRSGFLSIDLPPTTFTLPNGIASFDTGSIKIGNGTTDQFQFKSDQIGMTIAANAPIATLISAAKNEKPALPGYIREGIDIDVPPLARLMPQTIGLKPGVQVDGGRLKQWLTLDLSAGVVKPAVSVSITEVSGSTVVADDAGVKTRRPIALDPIQLDMKLDAYGGGWKLPDLRNLSLSIQSGFASGSFTGKSLATLEGSLQGDLSKINQQLGKFLSLDQYEIAGTFDVSVRSQGDPTKPADPAQLNAGLTARNLRLSGFKSGKSIAQPFIGASLNAVAYRNAAGDVEKLTGLKFALVTGSDTDRTIDLVLDAPLIQFIAGATPDATTRMDVPAFTLLPANIVLQKAQAEFGGMIPQLGDLNFNGVAALTGTGSFVNGVASFDGRLAVIDVTLARTLALATSGPISAVRRRMDVLTNYTLTADIGATYALVGKGAKIAVQKLYVVDNQNLFQLSKSSELSVQMSPGEMPVVTGGVKLGIDLGKVNDLLQKYSATTTQIIVSVAGGAKSVKVREGRLDGIATLSPSPDGSLNVMFDADITNLTVAGDTQLIAHENLKLSLHAMSAKDFASVTVDKMNVTGTLLTMDASALIQLTEGTGKDAKAVAPMAMVRRASATISASADKIQGIIDALSKPAAARASVLNRSRLQNGVPLPAMFAVAGPGLPAGAPTAVPSLLDQLAEIRVSELNASVLGTTVTLKEPLVVKGLAELMDLFASSGPAVVTTQPAAPAATPAGTPAAVPSAKLIGGSATITLDMTGDGKSLALNSALQMQKVSIAVGEQMHSLGDVTFKTSAVVTQKIGTAPVPASMTGLLSVSGQLQPLLELSAVLGGKPARSAYQGAFAFEERLGTDNGTIRVEGGGTIKDFAALDAQSKPQFTEKTIRLANNVGLDPRGQQVLSLTRFTLAMESSQALSIEASGKVFDFSRSRTIEGLIAKITYNGEKLWTIIHPMLLEPGTPAAKDRYKDYVIKGNGTRQFTLSGSYPAIDALGNAVASGVSIRTLVADGSFGLDLVDAEGVKIEKIELPVSVKDGILRVMDATQPAGQQSPAPYACNGGTINLANISIDLTGEYMRLNVPPNTKVLTNVQLTPALSNFIGDMINNPALVKPGETKGVIDLTVVECRDVPLGAQAREHSPANKGVAEVKYSFGGIQLGTESWAGIVSFLNVKSLQGAIKDGKVTYRNGYVGHDMTLSLGEQGRTIHLYGDVRLLDGSMMPMTMLFSPDWFGGDVAKYLPKGLPLSLVGPFSHPQYNVESAFQEAVKQNWFSGKPEDVGTLIDLFANKKKKKDPPRKPGSTQPAATTTQPGTPAAKDPLDDLLGGLFGKSAKDKEKEKKDREKSR